MVRLFVLPYCFTKSTRGASGQTEADGGQSDSRQRGHSKTRVRRYAGSLPQAARLGFRGRLVVGLREVRALRQFEIWWADLPKPAGRRPVLLLTRDDGYSYLN